MAAVVIRPALREGNALLVALACFHGALLLLCPSGFLIAVGVWWNANTISHNFIHRPFFRTRTSNQLFSAYLSLLLGFPQSFWRERHLAHHRGREPKLAVALPDVLALVSLWACLLAFAPAFAVTSYLPAVLTGLAICYLQGHYEHARGTTSHYGWLYNFLLINDGYHVEHHLHPGVDWRELPHHRVPDAASSCWPPVLRWLECVNLCALERLVLRSSMLQSFVLVRHERALRRLLPTMPDSCNAGIVGGGLFPRTAMLLRKLLPGVRLTVIEMESDNIAISRPFLGPDVEFITERFVPELFRTRSFASFDLLVIPLAFVGDRESIYRHPPAPIVLVHDWIWRRRGQSAVVSWLLLKRINAVRR